MFCPLEKLELKVSTCPVQRCMYKGVGGMCGYHTLTKDGVSVKDIAEVRQQKPYKIQVMAATAKQSVMTGTTLITYAEYIKDSFPDRKNLVEGTQQTVNTHDDTHVRKVLSKVFGLTETQQQHFWDNSRLTEWTSRHKLKLTAPDIRAALLSASASVS